MNFVLAPISQNHACGKNVKNSKFGGLLMLQVVLFGVFYLFVFQTLSFVVQAGVNLLCS